MKKIFIIEIDRLNTAAALSCFQSVFTSTAGPTADDLRTFDALEVAGAINSDGYAEVRCSRLSSTTRPAAGVTLWIDLVSATKERRFRLHTEQSRKTQPVEIIFGHEGSLAAACDVLRLLAEANVPCSVLRDSDESAPLRSWTRLSPEEALALAVEMGKAHEATLLDGQTAHLMGAVGAGKSRA